MESKEPTVKATPDFKVGETVIHKGSGQELKILKIEGKNLQCEGCAVLLEPHAVEKKI